MIPLEEDAAGGHRATERPPVDQSGEQERLADHQIQQPIRYVQHLPDLFALGKSPHRRVLLRRHHHCPMLSIPTARHPTLVFPPTWILATLEVVGAFGRVLPNKHNDRGFPALAWSIRRRLA